MLGFYSNHLLASVYQRYNPYLPAVIPKPTPVTPPQGFAMERLLAPPDSAAAAFLRQQNPSLDFFGSLRFPGQTHPVNLPHHLAQPLGISTGCPVSPETKISNEGLLKPVTVISRQS